MAVAGLVYSSFADYVAKMEALPSHFVMRDSGHLVVVTTNATSGLALRVTVTNHAPGWHVFVLKSKTFGGSSLVQRALVDCGNDG